ncbi:MAG: alpha-amylase family glycosyl hydrolase [Candidatus Eisenbacteria bacterium]
MRHLISAAVAALFLVPSLSPGGTPSPEDWRDQSIYQIMTDRFFDGDPSNNAVEGNYDPNDGYKIHGGDWAGIEAKLDYIRGLGMTALWISPVQKNAYADYHGYSIQNFYEMAPHFGGMADLRSLVDTLHASGMYMILDVIANHGANLIDSADPDWPAYHDPGDYTLRWTNPSKRHAPPFDDLSLFHNHGHIGDYSDPEQILGELWGLDDFATELPAVRGALIEAHRWLIDTVDADGFRIDTVKHVELDFWQEWGPAITAYTDSIGKAGFFQFGEIFDGSSWKNGIYTGTQAGGPFALESTLWYPMFFASGWVFKDGGPTEALDWVYGDSTYYDPTARNRLVKFLDNHDNARFMGFGSAADRDEAKAMVAQAWMYSSLGVPCIYYGSEQEFDGGGDPWDREDMWDGGWDFGPSEGDNFDQAAPLYRRIRRMNEMRRQLPALRRGAQRRLAGAPGPGLYAYVRTMAGESPVVVAFNTKKEADTLAVPTGLPAGTAYDLLSERTVTVLPGGAVHVVVGGMSAVWLAPEPPDPAPWVERTWPAHDGVFPGLRGRIEIAFTEPMDEASVESNITALPPFAYGASWTGNTLVLFPDADLADQTTYTVKIGSPAAAADGDPLGASFTFFFRVDGGAAPVAVPTGYLAAAIPGDDLRTPLSLAADGGGRLFLGDTGWDRIYRTNDTWKVETAVADSLVKRPNGIAFDREEGLFGGDLLISDSGGLLRVAGEGDDGGLVRKIAAWPGGGTTWALAVDRAGGFGGRAYVGSPSSSSLYAVDGNGTVSVFAGGLGSVTGLAFSEGGPFGEFLYAADGSGSVRRIDASGVVTTFTNDGTLLGGAAALAFDGTGLFGGDLFAVNPTRQEIVRIEPTGAVSSFASGFGSLSGPGGLAFAGLGDLYAVETGATGSPRIVKIAAADADTGVPGSDPAPPPTHRFLLGGNRPNPFNPETAISFELPKPGRALLTIHDIRGALIRTLVDADLGDGPHEKTWDGTNDEGRGAASGIYFSRLRYKGLEETKRMVLLR